MVPPSQVEASGLVVKQLAMLKIPRLRPDSSVVLAETLAELVVTTPESEATTPVLEATSVVLAEVTVPAAVTPIMIAPENSSAVHLMALSNASNQFSKYFALQKIPGGYPEV